MRRTVPCIFIIAVAIFGISLRWHAEGAIKKGLNYQVFAVKAITNDKLLPDSSPKGLNLKETRKLWLFASPGEYEPVSFAVYAPDGHGLKGLRVTASDLVRIGMGRKGRMRISSSNVDLRVVKCWYQAGVQVWDIKHKLLTPELLLKDDSLVHVDTEKKANILKPPKLLRDAAKLLPVDIPANTLRQFWVTVYVPENAAPGNYRGIIRLRAANDVPSELELLVKVLPIKLAKPFLNYAIYYRGRLAAKGTDTLSSELKSPKQYEAEMRNLKAHGIDNPTVYQPLGRRSDGSLDFTMLARVLALRKKAGIKGVPLLYLGGMPLVFGGTVAGGSLDELKNRVRALVRFAQKNGCPETYIYGIDEASGAMLKAERLAFAAIHEAGGKVFVACYSDFFEFVGDLLDLPIYAGIPSPELVAKVHRVRHKIWNYANPQCGVEEPYTYRHNYGLLLWKAGLDGTCDYAYQHSFGDIWNDFDHYHYRDHVMAYPTVDGVIDTIQWEGWRAGVDDVRYLTTLLRALERVKKVMPNHRVVRDIEGRLAALDISGDLQEIRWQMALGIIKLQELVKARVVSK